MWKRWTAALGAALLALTAAGCNLMPQQTAQEVLYNGYLGLTVTVPAGWYMEEISQQNLTGTPEQSETLDQMQFEENGDGGYYALLLSLGSRLSSSQDDHVSLYLYAEQYADIFPTLDDYVDDYLNYVVGDWGSGYYAVLTDIDEVTLSGVPFTRLTVESIHNSDDTVAYIAEHYITQIGELYFVAYIDYWADDDRYRETARETLESSVALSETDHPVGERRDSVYYNGYLGLAVTAPRDRYYLSLNEVNMTRAPEDSDDLEQLALNDYGEDGFYFDLLTMQTDLFDEDETFAILELYAVSDGEIDNIERFVDETRDATLAIEGSAYTRTLRTQTTHTLDGEQYSLLVFDIRDTDTGETLVEEIYMRQVRDLFFVARLNYDDNGDAAAAALEMLGTFTMSAGTVPISDGDETEGFVI